MDGRCVAGECYGASETGGAKASYYVSTVLYAPPGSNGASKSSVDYLHGSTTGTSTNVTSSFTNVASVGVTAGGNFVGSAMFGVQFDTTIGRTNSSELDVTKSDSTDFKVLGQQDGIDHNWDMIWLVLDPTVDVSLFPDNGLEWSLSNPPGQAAPVQYVYPAWLNGFAKMPADVAQTLANAGITESDYPTILARDPFSPFLCICLPGHTCPCGPPPIDTNRFTLQSFTFPYEPPPGVSNPGCNTLNKTLTTDTIMKTSNAFTDSYSVTLSAQGGLNFAVFSAKLSASDKMTWTNTNTSGTSLDNKQSASITIACPSSSYTGPTIVDVYLDTIYNTFLFAFDPRSTKAQRDTTARVRGIVTGPDGKPAAHEEVRLTAGDQTLRTYTDSEGNYYFFRAPEGPALVSARNVKDPVSISLPTTTRHDLALE